MNSKVVWNLNMMSAREKNEQKKMNNQFQGGLEPEPLPLMDLCRRVIRQQVGQLSIFKLFCPSSTFLLHSNCFS